MLQRGEAGERQRELDSLRHQVRELDDELLKLRSTAGTEQNAVQMERSTQQQLVNRVKTLESENAALREDMLLFERLIPATGDEASIRLESFRVAPDGPQRFRYRVLLAFQSARQVSRVPRSTAIFGRFFFGWEAAGVADPGKA